MTSRKLHLNRETVRVLTSGEMANVAGGALPLTQICGPKTLTNCNCTMPRPSARCTDICTKVTKNCTIK